MAATAAPVTVANVDEATFAATVVVMTVQDELAGAAATDDAAQSVTAASAEVTATAETAAGADAATAPVALAPDRPARSMLVALITPVPVIEAVMPATAELISSSLASGTRSFWLNMQPGSSSSVSQVLPFAVGSPIYSSVSYVVIQRMEVQRLTVPAANVPASRARRGSAPMPASC